MSGANFKVWVPLPDGRRCGIDVFGVLPHRRPLLRHRLADRHPGPLGAAALRRPSRSRVGRSPRRRARGGAGLHLRPGLAGPRPGVPLRPRPGRRRRMDAWFRGARAAGCGSGTTSTRAPTRPGCPTEPSSFARLGAERMASTGPASSRVLDVGAGTGRDAAYFAAQGHRVTALDFTTLGMRQTKRPREQASGAVHVPAIQPRGPAHRAGHRRPLRAPRRHPPGLRPRPARHARRRRSGQLLAVRARWCSAAAARPSWSSGPRARRKEQKYFGAHQRTYVDPDIVVREVGAYGGTVVHRETGRDLARLGHGEPGDLLDSS